MEQDEREIKVVSRNLMRWKYVILGTIIMVFLGTVYSYSVLRFSIEQLFKVGSTESGMPYMFALAFYAVFMFLTGKFLDRFKPRNIILLGGSLVSIGWILSSFAPNIIILTITYGVIGGSGVGIAYGVPMTVAARWFPEKKGLAVGLVLVGFGLSPLITAPLVRILVENFGLMRGFLILGISFGIILPFLAYQFKYPEIKGSDSQNTANLLNKGNNLKTSEMIKSKSFKGLYPNFIIGTMIGLTLIGMTTSIGIDFIGLEPRKITGLMAIFAIFNGIGRPIFGWLTDRLNSKRAMLLSYFLIISSAILIIILGENNPIIFIISFSIFWFNLGGWLSIAPASTLRLYGMKYYSQNYGLVFTAYGIGAVTGVSTSGLILDILGNYHFVFYYIIGLSLVGILLTMILIEE